MSGRGKIGYAALGTVAAALGIAEVAIHHGGGLPQLVIFAIAPDLALMLGMGSGLARGQIHPRAVAVYNTVHRLPLPVVLIGLALWAGWSAWLAGGLAWAAHIAFDRSLGFGLRDRAGFQRQPSG